MIRLPNVLPQPKPLWRGLALALMLPMTLGATLALAQETTTTETQPPAPEASADLTGLPEGCRKALPEGAMTMQMPGMSGNMGQTPNGTAMQRMNGPMMAAMQITDPDLAFACGMIPHHQGAIDMAEQVLNAGKDTEIKEMAGKMIRDQQKEIEKLRDWIDAHAAE